MAEHLITTKELMGLRVVAPSKRGERRIGKVHQFVFHPKEKRIIGFTVKRPDIVFMFHRKDLFVRVGCYEKIGNLVSVSDDAHATGTAAIHFLDIDWESCVFWTGMPVMTAEGKPLGFVGAVTFEETTGVVHAVEVDAGLANDALVGKRSIPAHLVRGFRIGKGVELAQSGKAECANEDEALRGAIVVADEALDLDTEGGIAESAGKATAVAVDKAKTAMSEAKPVANKVAKKTGTAVNKGVYATGKQIGKARGMFTAFKKEYDKARKEGK